MQTQTAEPVLAGAKKRLPGRPHCTGLQRPGGQVGPGRLWSWQHCAFPGALGLVRRDLYPAPACGRLLTGFMMQSGGLKCRGWLSLPGAVSFIRLFRGKQGPERVNHLPRVTQLELAKPQSGVWLLGPASMWSCGVC